MKGKQLGAFITLVKTHAGEWLDPHVLAASLGVTPGRVVELADSARAHGLVIAREPYRGLRLTAPPFPLIREELEYDLGTRVVGSRIVLLKAVGSTNDHAVSLARRGAPEGTVVIAGRQTRGRGRMGRRWECVEGQGLLFSVILRPRIVRGGVPLLTIEAAVAVADAVRETLGRKARIRWPNDVVWRGRKFCGILVEGDPRAQDGHFIVGIGINTGRVPAGVPKATSLGEMVGSRPPGGIGSRRTMGTLTSMWGAASSRTGRENASSRDGPFSM